MKKNLIALSVLIMCLSFLLVSFVSCDFGGSSGSSDDRDDKHEEAENEEDDETSKKRPGGLFWQGDEDTDSEKTENDTNNVQTAPSGTSPDDTATDRPHEHSFGKWSIRLNPTCTKGGEMVRYCDCGFEETQAIGPTEHEYVITEKLDATCREEGYTIYICNSCGDSYSTTDPIIDGHTPSDWIKQDSSNQYLSYLYKQCIFCETLVEQKTELNISLPTIEKSAFDDIGSVYAGEVDRWYTPIGSVGISSLEEIKDPYGSYYLTADINDNAHTVAEFYGLLDGCGHVITTSEPLFDVLGGTVTNLMIAGNISYEDVAKAPLANDLVDSATIVNCRSDAHITVKENNKYSIYAAGFALRATGKVTFVNCAFEGAIENVSNFKGNKRYSAGFVAVLGKYKEPSDLVVVNCSVSGSVTGSSTVGGLVAVSNPPSNMYFYGVAVTAAAEIVSTYESYAGGFLGSVAGLDAFELEVVNCYNAAAVVGAPAPAKSYAGGFVGNISNTGFSNVNFEWCTNYGDVVSTCYSAGIVGLNNSFTTYIDCINFGIITANDPFSENDTSTPTKSDNFAGGIVAYQYAALSNAIQCHFTNCLNYGEISVGSKHVRAGGIVGYFGYSGGRFENCVNFAPVYTTYVSKAAGDADYCLGGITSGGTGQFTVIECVNFGDVVGSFYNRSLPIGGIIGFVDSAHPDNPHIIENCINHGTVSSLVYVGNNIGGSEIGGIVGIFHYNSAAVIKNCVNAGMLDGLYRVNDIAGQNSSNTPFEKCTFENNHYLQNAYITPGLNNTVYGAYGYGGYGYRDQIYDGASARAFTAKEFGNPLETGLVDMINSKAGYEVYTVTRIPLQDGTYIIEMIPTNLTSVIIY